MSLSVLVSFMHRHITSTMRVEGTLQVPILKDPVYRDLSVVDFDS